MHLIFQLYENILALRELYLMRLLWMAEALNFIKLVIGKLRSIISYILN